jgi:hypothetical protein
VFSDQELSTIILSTVTDLTEKDMKMFKKWLTRKTPNHELKEYLQLDVKALPPRTTHASE